jgi:hypothetical protein
MTPTPDKPTRLLTINSALFCGANLLVMLVAACSQVPELDNVITPHLERADYPDLVPLQRALAVQTPPGKAADELEDEMNARRERLQSKAQQLNTAAESE